MIICGTAVLKIYDWILGLDFDNIWTAGFKVGFIAWGLMLIYGIIATLEIGKVNTEVVIKKRGSNSVRTSFDLFELLLLLTVSVLNVDSVLHLLALCN